MATTVQLPGGVRGMVTRGPDWARWVERLPRLAGDLLGEWELTPDGWSMHGYCSLVVPVRTADDARAVLKITFDGDEESALEHLALQRWAGRGAVRLLRANPHRRAMLLDRIGPADLRARPDVEACEVVAGLYPALHVPALPQLRTLTSYVERWTADLAALPRSAPLPHRLVEQAVSLGRGFVTDPDSVGRVVHGDLHYVNVLAGRDGDWLAIDPKPMSGDPHYEPAPMLWNRFEELAAPGAGHRVRTGVRRRFHALVDAAGLDEARARDWVVVRMLARACWTLRDSRGRALTAEEEDRITTCVTIAKAVQD
jgi:streptomycin 6-kinase